MEEFDDEHLISLVSQFRIIFDKSTPNFRSKDQRRNAWVTIANIMGNTSAEECEKRFTVLRNRYGAEKRQIMAQSASGMAGFPEPSWPLYKSMGFLEKHMATRKRATKTNVAVDTARTESPDTDGLLSPTSQDSVWDSMREITSQNPPKQNQPEMMALPGPSGARSEPDKAVNAETDVSQPGSATAGPPILDQAVPGPSGLGKSADPTAETMQKVKQLRQGAPVKRKRGPVVSDSMQTTMEATLDSVKTYLVQKSQIPPATATKSFGVTVELMLNGIRNSKRRRKTQVAIMAILADTNSNSEDSE